MAVTQRRVVHFDVMAQLSLEGRPSEPCSDKPNWLVVCRRCGWHVETAYGCCWSGCPGCNADLWVIDEQGNTCPASQAHDHFKPRRRRNAWRSAMPTVSRGTPL